MNKVLLPKVRLVHITPMATTVAYLTNFFGTCKLTRSLVYKLSNKHSNQKLVFLKVVSLSRFHYKSFIKSLISKIFFSAWSGRLAHKPAQTEMSAILSRSNISEISVYYNPWSKYTTDMGWYDCDRRTFTIIADHEWMWLIIFQS